MSSPSPSPFQDANGQRIRSISTTTQLKRFLSGEWKEKTKAILGAQCLSIRRPDGLWVFQMSKNGKLIHTSFGKFPEVSMAQAKEKAFEHRRSIQENGVAPGNARKGLQSRKPMCANSASTTSSHSTFMTDCKP